MGKRAPRTGQATDEIWMMMDVADWAVQNKHLKLVKLLLEKVEDLDVLAQNSFGHGCITAAFQVDDADICTPTSRNHCLLDA
jgi:hypothetical protein